MTIEPYEPRPPLPYPNRPDASDSDSSAVPLPGLESDAPPRVREPRPADRWPTEVDRALTDALAAARRVEEFLDARSRMTLLDPQEVTGVYVGEQLLVLDRDDLQMLARFVRAQVRG